MAREAKFVPTSRSDRPLPDNAMTLMVSIIWQNLTFTGTINMFVHGTRSLIDGNTAVRIVEQCQQPRSYKVESASVSIRQRN